METRIIRKFHDGKFIFIPQRRRFGFLWVNIDYSGQYAFMECMNAINNTKQFMAQGSKTYVDKIFPEFGGPEIYIGKESYKTWYKYHGNIIVINNLEWFNDWEHYTPTLKVRKLVRQYGGLDK